MQTDLLKISVVSLPPSREVATCGWALQLLMEECQSRAFGYGNAALQIIYSGSHVQCSHGLSS